METVTCLFVLRDGGRVYTVTKPPFAEVLEAPVVREIGRTPKGVTYGKIKVTFLLKFGLISQGQLKRLVYFESR